MYGGNGGDGKLLSLQTQIGELRELIRQTEERFAEIEYAALLGKPKINGVELGAETSLAALGAAEAAAVPAIGYIDETSAQNYTLTSGGYYRLTVPSSLPSGAKIFAVTILEYASASGDFHPEPYGSTQAYIIGTPGASIQGLKCRYWHIK